MTMDYSNSAVVTKKPLSYVQSSNCDIKQQYKNVYTLLKQFDEEKQKITNIHGIFDARVEELRNAIIEQSTALIYQTEYEVIGRKCREILWFKGFYDLISLAKRFWRKNNANDKRSEDQISNLIIEGISHFKFVIVNLEQKFSLDLRNVMDFSFLDTNEKSVCSAVATQNSVYYNENRSHDENIKYTMETIHALLISLGDLHRYFIDFNFNMPKIGKDYAANYYYEAFKLNPKSGMAHNQLGTLLAGSHYDLDSIYHYLYSLSCPIPFELSDNRVMLLFEKNAAFLEQLENANDKGDTVCIRDFIAQYIFVVDVFFYDKDITDFNALCHCLLLDFRKLLKSNRTDLSADQLFKMVAIFFFCLIKLRMVGSNKFHSLNAFMVALCAEFIDACILKFDRFVVEHEKQNEEFQKKYLKEFIEFEMNVRAARESHRRYLEKNDHGDADILSSERSQPYSDESLKIKPTQFNGMDDAMASSSGRDRESDVGKSTQNSSQPRSQTKRKTALRRRRRRVLSENSNSDLSYSSASEYDMDTDFSSNDVSDEDDNESWLSSDNEEDDDKDESSDECSVNNSKNHEVSDDKTVKSIYIEDQDDDDEDVIIENEEIIYPNAENLSGNSKDTQLFDGLMRDLEDLKLYNASNTEHNNDLINFSTNGTNNSSENGENFVYSIDAKGTNPIAPEKLRYKQKYAKIDPNIVIEFSQYDTIMRALKLLFSWLRANNNILINCFSTNPEFIEKIFDLLNRINIDVFTRKVYLERHHIRTNDVREELRSLFDIRQTIPLKEDILMKEFATFDVCQRYLDWSLPITMNITENEETILRLFEFVDFGFSLCKMKKFNVSFCSRSRKFIQIKSESRSLRRNRKRGRRNRKRDRTRKRRNPRNDASVVSRDDEHTKSSNGHVKTNIDGKNSNLKKGYLRNRQQTGQNTDICQSSTKSSAKTHEIMGKLWLQHEIEVLEAKMSRNKMILPPYIIVDTKALTNYLDIVKKFVKTKKTVVLIPKAVLAELDDLKKTSDIVRNTIRWLEYEFTNGSRFIRLQRNNETKQLPLIKIPKKLDREAATFVLIAQFCNFINENHAKQVSDMDALNTQIQPNVAVFLTSEKLIDSKSSNISCTGILDAIGIHYETIREFYAKFKKK